MEDYEILNTPEQEKEIHKVSKFANLCIFISCLSIFGFFSIFLIPINIASLILCIILKFKIRDLYRKSIFYNEAVKKINKKFKISITITITVMILCVFIRIIK